MTFDLFVSNFTGKRVDTDNAYGAQCMDLMHKYCQEVLGLQDLRILSAPAAKDVYINFNNIYGREKFLKIDNTPTGIPEKGDIMFWGTGIGPYGHVAIYHSGDVNKFKSFDQNFPVGSSCHLQDHSYKGVLGWLRYKQGIVDPLQKVIDDIKKACDEQTTNVSKIAKIKFLIGQA